jgi:hypothetical protein
MLAQQLVSERKQFEMMKQLVLEPGWDEEEYRWTGCFLSLCSSISPGWRMQPP